MNFKIVSDSSSNLYELADVAYESVPLKIITTQAEYVDTAALDVAAMVDEIKNTKGKSGTSCPNAQEWLDSFDGGDAVFAVTITSNLSGSYAAAVNAAQEYEESNPGKKVFVIDSLSAGPELGLIVDRLREWVLEGLSFEKIKEKVMAYKEKTHLSFSLESLTNLARNGRVNPAVAKIAGVLGIRVVGVASDHGTLEPLHKCRGEKKALEAIFADMKERHYRGGRVRIAHCFNLNAAKQLMDMIRKEFGKSEISIEPCGGLCSFYAERGGLLVGYESC